MMKVQNEQTANTLVTKRRNYFINILATFRIKWTLPTYFFFKIYCIESMYSMFKYNLQNCSLN